MRGMADTDMRRGRGGGRGGRGRGGRGFHHAKPAFSAAHRAEEAPLEPVAKATRALEHAAALIAYLNATPGAAKTSAGRVKDLQNQLDTEFFGRKGAQTALQSLRLRMATLQLLAGVYADPATARHSYSYFSALFLGREGESGPHEQRMAFLGELCLLALQWPGAAPLFADVALWLGKIGLGKPYAAALVARLVQEFAVQEELRGFLLRLGSGPFAAAFAALAVQPYTSAPPPPGLVRLLGAWLVERPTELLGPVVEGLASPDALSLPRMLADSLARLARWAVLLPGDADWARVHAGLLSLALAFRATMDAKEAKEPGSREIFPILTEVLLRGWVPEIGRGDGPGAALQRDRFAHLLQVMSTCGCFYGSPGAVAGAFQSAFPAQPHPLIEYIGQR